MSRYLPMLSLYFTLIVALMLELMPLPAALNLWRPSWLLLIFAYWVLARPHQINIGHGWLLGLLLDVLLGSPLGLHALALSLAAYVLASNFQRLRTMGLLQQSLLIGCLCALTALLQLACEWLINGEKFTLDYLQSALVSTLLWPWLFVLLRRLRRRFPAQ